MPPQKDRHRAKIVQIGADFPSRQRHLKTRLAAPGLRMPTRHVMAGPLVEYSRSACARHGIRALYMSLMGPGASKTSHQFVPIKNKHALRVVLKLHLAPRLARVCGQQGLRPPAAFNSAWTCRLLGMRLPCYHDRPRSLRTYCPIAWGVPGGGAGPRPLGMPSRGPLA